MKVLYITPQFPQYRHGFELVELRHLSGVAQIEVLSLRNPSDSEWLWLESAWPQGTRPPIRIASKNIGFLMGAKGLLALLSKTDFTSIVLKALKQDLRGAWKVLLSSLGAAAVYEQIRISRFDILHADFASAPATVAALLSQMTGTPFTLCGHAFDVFSTKPAGRASAAMLSWKLHLSAIAFAENSKVSEVFYSLNPDVRIKLKRNAVELAKQSTVVRRPSPLKVVGLGALVAKKGFDVLILAAAKLVSQYPALTVAIHGEGPERERLENLAKKVGIRCEMPGAYNFGELPNILLSARIVAVPSRRLQDNDSDGVPTVFLEALNAGCPIIGTDVGAVSDLISDGITGGLVQADQPEALAIAIDRFLKDPAFASRTVIQGQVLLREKFSAEQNATIMIDEWMKLLNA